MTVRNLAYLKSRFNNGDIPTEDDFSDMFETFHRLPIVLFIAAVNATALSLARADYVCDGVDDQVQIQAAIDALPATGGKILLSEGTFTLKTGGSMAAAPGDPGGTDYYCVKIATTHPPLEIAGIPGVTIVTLADDQDDSPYMIAIRGSGTSLRTNPTTITGINFDGNGPGQSAPPLTDYMPIIMGQFSRNIKVENCEFRNWEIGQRTAIHMQYKTQKVWIVHNYFYGQQAMFLENDYKIVSNNIFEDPTATVPGYASLSLTADYDTFVTPGVRSTHWGTTITGNIFKGGSIQLFMIGVHGVTVTGNVFMDQSNASQYCLVLKSDTALTGFDALNNLIIANTFVNCQNPIGLVGGGTTGARENIVAHNTMGAGLDRGVNWGIVEGGGTTGNNLIVDNYVEGGSGKIVSTGTGTIVRGNLNYTTEKYGAAAALADGATIDHGLVKTPTWVSLVGSVAGEIVSATALDATHITVAIKKHDGTPGTAQTVYWEAKV